jgi:hypothetical protein
MIMPPWDDQGYPVSAANPFADDDLAEHTAILTTVAMRRAGALGDMMVDGVWDGAALSPDRRPVWSFGRASFQPREPSPFRLNEGPVKRHTYPGTSRGSDATPRQGSEQGSRLTVDRRDSIIVSEGVWEQESVGGPRPTGGSRGSILDGGIVSERVSANGSGPIADNRESTSGLQRTGDERHPTFVFRDTVLEIRATLRHLDEAMESIQIHGELSSWRGWQLDEYVTQLRQGLAALVQSSGPTAEVSQRGSGTDESMGIDEEAADTDL